MLPLGGTCLPCLLLYACEPALTCRVVGWFCPCSLYMHGFFCMPHCTQVLFCVCRTVQHCCLTACMCAMCHTCACLSHPSLYHLPCPAFIQPTNMLYLPSLPSLPQQLSAMPALPVISSLPACHLVFFSQTNHTLLPSSTSALLPLSLFPLHLLRWTSHTAFPPRALPFWLFTFGKEEGQGLVLGLRGALVTYLPLPCIPSYYFLLPSTVLQMPCLLPSLPSIVPYLLYVCVCFV